MKVREAEEYKTGFGSSHILVNLSELQLTSFSFPILEVPDLVHGINIEVFWGWDQKQGGYLQMLWHIRISSTDPEKVIVLRPGQHPRLISAAKVTTTGTTPKGDMETMDGTR